MPIPARSPAPPHITNSTPIIVFILPAQTSPRPVKPPASLRADLKAEGPYILAGTTMAVVVVGLITALGL